MSHEPSGRGAKRFVRPLPSNPNLDKQRKLAKALARDYWRGKSEAIARVRALHPKPPTPENFVLSDAQLVIARGYGFAGWAQLKRKIESLNPSPVERFKAAVEAGDVDHVRQLLQSDPDLVSMINEPMFSFKSPAVHVARTNLELLDLLLVHGADLNARTCWEKGSFGVLEQVNPDEAAPLIARGARIDVWAAANLGMMAELMALIAGDPSLVHAKGGDGKPYRLYIASIGGIKIDVTDRTATLARVSGWLSSEEGGLRLAREVGTFLAYIIGAILVARIVRMILRRFMSGDHVTSHLLRDFIISSSGRVIIAIGFLLALSALEVNLAPLLAVIGAAGFVVAFALQGTLSNFASGLLIMVFKPFDVGDDVEVGGGIKGKVTHVTIFSTYIRTDDGITKIVPNDNIWKSVIVNETTGVVKSPPSGDAKPPESTPEAA